ncbi:MAG: hypothetical protein ACM33B_11975 [Pseudomonadota bacterium]
MAARISIAVVLAVAVLLLVTRGLHAFVVFAFFAAVAGGAAFAAGLGGEWLTRASAGRFRDRDR